MIQVEPPSRVIAIARDGSMLLCGATGCTATAHIATVGHDMTGSGVHWRGKSVIRFHVAPPSAVLATSCLPCEFDQSWRASPGWGSATAKHVFADAQSNAS